MRLADRARELARLQGRAGAWALRVRPVVDPALPAKPLCSLWNSPSAWLVADGSAGCWQAAGPGRHALLAQRAAELRHRCVIDAPADAPALPCLLLQSAFAADPRPDSLWGGLGGGSRLLLPERCWWRTAGRTWLIEATAVDQPSRPEAPAPSIAWPVLQLPDYQSLVADARVLLERTALRKVVLCRAEDRQLPRPIDHLQLLQLLRDQADAESWCYDCALPGGRRFTGLSPELLLAADGADWHAMALAGSRPRADDAAADVALGEDLLGNTKERKEHQLVVEHLDEHLRPRSDDFQLPDRPRLRRLERVQHLQTDLYGRFRDADRLSLLDALHPTPAVCGLPAPLSRDWILHREGLDRGLYTGLLGYCTPERCRFIVALRGALIDGDQARLFAGAGIVERSDPAAELAETNLKMDLMQRVLAAAGPDRHGGDQAS